MTRIDFYLLPDQGLDAAQRFACRLSLKALQGGQAVHIHTNSETDSQTLDELMWHYPQHRFIPHEIGNSSGPATSSAVSISHSPPNSDAGLLINLSGAVPNFYGRFDRVAEVIVGDTREDGRERYKFYRSRGYPLHHHELENWEQ